MDVSTSSMDFSTNFDNNTIKDSKYVQFGHNINYNYGTSQGDSKQNEKRQLLEWISADSASDRYQALLDQHQQGTGGWLVSHDRFERWLSRPQTSSFLWLSGKMGSGKSVLASVVVQQLRRAGILPNFFFCDRASRSHQLRNASGIYACLLRQLVQELTTTPKDLSELYNLGERLSERTARDQIISLLQAKTQHHRTVVLLFDALDECDFEVRESVMYDFLAPLLTSPHAKVKVFLSSRHESDIEQFFSSHPTNDIESFRLEVESSEDINAYIHEQVQRLPMSTSGKAKVINTLTSRCDGMFRWAEMCITSLKKPGSETSRLQRIDLIPRGLMEIYDEIYSGTRFIDREDQQIVRRALSYITSPNWHCSDILAFELVGAVYGEDDDRSPQEMINELLDLCCHMVILDAGEFPRFRLAHVSVREFLEQKHEVVYLGSHLSLAMLCIETACKFFENPDRTWELGQFVCYALIFWPKHTYLARRDWKIEEKRQALQNSEMLRYVMDGDVTDSESFDKQSAWVRYIEKLRKSVTWLRDEFLWTSSDYSILTREMAEQGEIYGMRRRHLPNPLFIFGRHDVEEILLTQNPIPALAWSIRQQGLSIFEALCNMTHATDLRYNVNRLPRLMAVLPSHSKAVLMGALKNQGEVLVNAVKEQNQELIEFLLQHSCSVLGADAEGITVLHYSAGFFDLGMTERFVSLGADANAYTNRSESPLMSLFLAPATQDWEWSWKTDQSKVMKFIKRVKFLFLCLHRHGANLFHRNVAGFAAVDLQQLILEVYRPSPPNQVKYLFHWIRELMKRDMILQICRTGAIKTSGGWQLGNPRSVKRWRNLVRRMGLPGRNQRKRSRLLHDGEYVVD